jgi:hypothetical protein
MATTGDGTLIKGGALAAGEARDFPEPDFQFSFDRPFIITHLKGFVGRVAGGDETDSDYENVYLNVKDLVRNEDITKDPVPLSVLLDRERRMWRFEPGQLILRKLGSGLKIRAIVNPGAVGAPYNIEIAVHGYTELLAEVPEGMLPEER